MSFIVRAAGPRRARPWHGAYKAAVTISVSTIGNAGPRTPHDIGHVLVFLLRGSFAFGGSSITSSRSPGVTSSALQIMASVARLAL